MSCSASSLSDLPAAVQKTVDKETHGGEILKKSKEGPKYEISFVKMGMTKRIAADETGASRCHRERGHGCAVLAERESGRHAFAGERPVHASDRGRQKCQVSKYVGDDDAIFLRAIAPEPVV